MGYVQAGYSIVLGLLFLYGLQLLWRRRRLNRAVTRVLAAETGVGAGSGPAGPVVGPPPGDR